MKYRTLHYLNITYCLTYYDVHTSPCVLSVTALWHHSVSGMNLTSVLLTRW